MTDDAKDLWNDISTADKRFDTATCESRESLLKALTGASDPQAGHYRFQVLKEIGMCEFIKGDYVRAKKRLDSGVSELNLPNDDMMTSNQELAPVGLLRQAAGLMTKFKLTEAATALRRSREIADRNVKKMLKMLHKQITGQHGADKVPPLEKLIEEIPGFGQTGQILPELMKQAPILQQELPFMEQIDKAVEELDRQLTVFAPEMKTIRTTLDSKQRGGSLLYARGLVAEAVSAADRSGAAQEFLEAKGDKTFLKEAEKAEKSVTLLKRTGEGSGCKGKGFDETCEIMSKVADFKSNIFGETRVLVLKAGKQQQLEMCSTNANLAMLVSNQDGVKVTVGKKSTTDLLKGLPVMINFCQEITLDSEKAAVVLFAQAWHPEFAAVERTTELRNRAKGFSVDEDGIKEATKVVNDYAKKNWEKSRKDWLAGSELLETIQTSLTKEASEAAAKAEAAAEAKRKEEMDGDETRTKNLEELQKKRDAKKKKQEEHDAKRLKQKLQREAERANRDPWLNDPAVLEAETNLNNLKEARREANAKLEFDLTADLTKDISTAERTLKKATKVAKKAHKKSGGKAAPKVELSEDAKAESKALFTQQTAELKQKLEDVKKKKAEAAENEDFAGAKKLKEKQKELEEKLKKLDPKAEL